MLSDIAIAPFFVWVPPGLNRSYPGRVLFCFLRNLIVFTQDIGSGHAGLSADGQGPLVTGVTEGSG